jgi:hypothetical protein
MSCQSTTFRKVLTVALILAVGSFYSLIPTSAIAQSASKTLGAAGELSVSGSVTINGTQAITGATIFSESRVKTARNSTASVSLGRLGRVQLGPESEMTLHFTGSAIGGNLAAGRTVVNAPAGVSITVATTEGVATSDGKLASALTVDVTCGNTRVAATRNSAKVTTGSKVENVAAGTEVAVGQAQAPRCTRLSTAGRGMELSAGGIAALIIAGVGGAVAGIVAASQSDEVTPSSIVVSGFRP